MAIKKESSGSAAKKKPTIAKNQSKRTMPVIGTKSAYNKGR